MKKITVLITHAGSEICHGIIKGLSVSSLSCRFIVTGVNPLETGFYLAHKGYVVPPSLDKPKEFVSEIISICRKEKVDVIMSGGDMDLLVLAQNKSSIEDQTRAKVIVSDEKTLSICMDKFLTSKFLEDNNLPSPFTVLPQDISKLLNKTNFPIFVKPRRGTGSKDAFIVRNMDELQRILPQVSDPVLQEYLQPASEEYTCGTLYFDSLLGVVCMKRELKRGATYRAIIDNYPRVKKQAESIAKALKAFGPANIQGRLTARGFLAHEINCRFSGTTGMRAFAGFAEHEAAIRYVLFKEKISIKAKNMVCLRFPQELFVSANELSGLRKKGFAENKLPFRGAKWQNNLP